MKDTLLDMWQKLLRMHLSLLGTAVGLSLAFAGQAVYDHYSKPQPVPVFVPCEQVDPPTYELAPPEERQ